MYRPQFCLPAAPAGFQWQPCIYQFSPANVPALGSVVLAAGAETGYIPLPLDHDAPFVLLAIKIEAPGIGVQLFDPWSNELMDDFLRPELYASDLAPFTILEGPGIEVLAGSLFSVRLQGE